MVQTVVVVLLYLCACAFTVEATQAVYSDHDCLSKDHVDVPCRGQYCKAKDNGSVRSCIFRNLCYDSDPSVSAFVYYHDGDGGSSLPSSTRVNKKGETVWNTERPFTDSWRVALNTPSDYEVDKVGKFKWRPVEHRGALPTDDVEWRKEVPFLFARTPSDDNLGHVLFDTYLPLMSAVDTWLGLKAMGDVVPVDYRNASDVWLPSHAHKYQEIRYQIGSLLWSSTQSLEEFAGSASPRLRCFERVLVGTGGQEESGLHGGAFMRQRPLTHLKRTLLQAFLPSGLAAAGRQGSQIHVTLLEKKRSHTGHNNFVANWDEVVVSVAKALGNGTTVADVVVRNVDPGTLTFSEQVRLLHTTDVAVGLWGGVSAMNFMLPHTSVQVIISNWWPYGGDPKPNDAAKECVDYEGDWRGGMGLHGSKTLLFCVRNPKRNGNGKTFPDPVDVPSLTKLVGRAVQYARHHRRQKHDHHANAFAS